MTAASPERSGEIPVVPGHEDACAPVEGERRFLMAGPPPGGAGAAARRADIVDRYLTGTRLRLRRVSSPGSAEPELKLTQKVPATRPPRHGLVLAEVELGSDADLAACPAPARSVAEVTADDRFTDGRLAVTPRAELLGWLAGFGLEQGGDEAG
jgi:hypothetical protein